MSGNIVVGTALLLFDQTVSILLAKRLNTLHCPGFYACPGGKLDAGETLTACIKRECLEETGIEVDPQPLGFIGEHPNTDIGHVICHWFIASVNRFKVEFIEKNALGQPKVEGWDWHNHLYLPENTMFGTKKAVDYYKKHGISDCTVYGEESL